MMLKNVEIYSKSNCVFCDKAKNYFKQNNVPYKEYNVEIPEVFDALITRNPNARTMPQIFIDDELIPLNEWISTNDGLLDFLETRYHEAVADPIEDDEHTFLFFIGDTSECAYKTYEEFKADLDLDYVSDLFKKCWERSCNIGGGK